jgi:acyl-CoA reductase-like NAD-dependent aldehyde dehydrogenase
LIKIARDCLKPIPQDDDNESSRKYIIKQPIGVIAYVAAFKTRSRRKDLANNSALTPWNYPHLCIVNSVVPALLSGNAVILKPAPQTPAPAERVLSSFLAAGLPTNVLQVIHLDQKTTLDKLVADPRIDFVAFTGSVVGGRAVQGAAAKGKGFKGVGLELGGKDPAYVRADAELKNTVDSLVDGERLSCGTGKIWKLMIRSFLQLWSIL